MFLRAKTNLNSFTGAGGAFLGSDVLLVLLFKLVAILIVADYLDDDGFGFATDFNDIQLFLFGKFEGFFHSHHSQRVIFIIKHADFISANLMVFEYFRDSQRLRAIAVFSFSQSSWIG